MTHPPLDRLRAFARHAVDTPARLLMEAHLALCADCQRAVGALGPSAADLPLAAAGPLPPGSFERLWERIEQIGARACPPEARALPAGILAALPDPAAWRWFSTWPQTPRTALLMRDPDSGSHLYLSHYPRGSRYPRHAHLGLEENVILLGGYQNGPTHAEQGDWVIGTPGTAHELTTAPDEECWCLSRVEPPYGRFSGWRGWIQDLQEWLARRGRPGI